jgi:uncharacterized cupredoxin-like copper-binding protein
MRTRHALVRIGASALGLAGLGLGLAACDDDDGGSEEDVAAVQASIDAINQASLDGNTENIGDYVTEDGAQAIFGASIEDIQADPELIANESEADNFVADEIEVDGDEADAIGGFPGSEEPSVLSAPLIVEFVKEDDNWKANGMRAGDAEEPDGATTVAMELNEFAFEFDEGEIEAGTPVFFEVDNTGEQVHEMVLVRLEEGVVLEDALAEDEPEGVEFLGGVFGFEAGQEADVALSPGLEAGRYAFVCFLPDTSADNPEDQVPHAFLGMTKEFEVN